MTLESRPGVYRQDNDPNPNIPRLVYLGDRRIGIRTQELSLDELIGSEKNEEGHVDSLFLRTTTGNIYLLEWDGSLIDRNESRKAGSLVEYEIDISRLVEVRIGLGDRFPKELDSQIEELVVTSEDWLDVEPGGIQYSSIMKDFYVGLPD